MTETKRDLHADLAICNAATAGPWKVGGGKFGETNVYAGDTRVVRDIDYDKEADATFIAEARTAWHHAIERAISAEAEVERLKAHIKRAIYLLARDACVPAEIELDAALYGGGRG